MARHERPVEEASSDAAESRTRRRATPGRPRSAADEIAEAPRAEAPRAEAPPV